MLYSCIETPPSEPPIFEIPLSVTVLENEPIFIQIAASVPGTNSTEGLYLYVENLPARSTFSRGRREGERWIITPEDFGEIELDLPDFLGTLNLEITAVTPGASRQRSLLVIVQSNTTDEIATTTDQASATTKGRPEAEGTPEATGATPDTDHGGTGADLYIRVLIQLPHPLHEEMTIAKDGIMQLRISNFPNSILHTHSAFMYRVSFWTRSHLVYNLGYYSIFYNWHPGMPWRGGVHR